MRYSFDINKIGSLLVFCLDDEKTYYMRDLPNKYVFVHDDYYSNKTRIAVMQSTVTHKKYVVPHGNAHLLDINKPKWVWFKQSLLEAKYIIKIPINYQSIWNQICLK